MVIDPKVAETRHYLGVIHLAAGRPGHARAMWSSAVELRPDYLAALVGLAALDRTAGLPSASDRYARVLELDPDDVEARRAHGELLSEAGQLEEAQDELERVVAVAPNDLRARRALALVLASRHAGIELAAELQEVVRLDPDDLDARLDLGAALTAIGQVDPAIAVYEEVLRRRPRQAPVLKLVGDLYRAKGDGTRAAALYETLRRVAPDDPRPVFLLGSAYYLAGRLDAAERMFTEGVALPGHARRRLLEPGRDRGPPGPGQRGALVLVARGAAAPRQGAASATTMRWRFAQPSASTTPSTSWRPP